LFGRESWANRGRREGKAHDPFSARGAQPVQDSNADAAAYIEAVGNHDLRRSYKAVLGVPEGRQKRNPAH
jgi:hypothetical protein